MERFASDGALIKQLLSAGILTEVQVVKDRMNTKKALTVFPPAGGSGLEEAWPSFLPELTNSRKCCAI